MMINQQTIIHRTTLITHLMSLLKAQAVPGGAVSPTCKAMYLANVIMKKINKGAQNVTKCDNDSMTYPVYSLM